MKTIISILLLICSLTMNAQIYLHAGTSPIKGSVGLEIQPLEHLSLGGGYRFTRLWSAGNIHSWSGNINYYFTIEPALLYVSLGVASKGIVNQNEYGMWTTPIPAQYLMVGTRYYPYEIVRQMGYKFPKRLSFDVGIGWSISKYTAPELVIDFEINVAITRLRNGR
jgi:hypothetical protein